MRSYRRLVGMLTPLLLLAWGCNRGQAPSRPLPTSVPRPNILFVVWDTVRADHLSLYGYGRQTTPYLDEWAEQARVFENCTSAGSTTAPAHASMFTGLLPTEHNVSYKSGRVDDRLQTLAELLKAAGYDTYLFAENPQISKPANFTQGFDLAEHPWSRQYYDEALRIALQKAPRDDISTDLSRVLREGKALAWQIKAAGELAQVGTARWLASRDSDRPFFIFLNYMEAHGPLIPRRSYRERFMTPEGVNASYKVDRTWEAAWSYSVGLHSYSPRDIGLTRATYDAALLELDDLLHDLLHYLGSRGHLENTVVVLVGDHGELLGEHHMFDHQFAVYDQLLRVPLVIHYPPRFVPGREKRPVMNLDLFPTILALTGIDPPVKSKAVSLLDPLEHRPRMSEYPAPLRQALRRLARARPDFDPKPWARSLRAYYDEPYKFIAGSDGRHELYNLDQDPGELNDLIQRRPEVARRIAADLQAYVDSLITIEKTRATEATEPVDEDHLRRLEALGYATSPDDDDEEDSNDSDEP